MKFLFLLVLLSIGCKLVFGRWPWEWAAGSARRQAEARARVLLGVRSGSTREEVIEAHRRLVVMVHPDKGGTSEQVHEANAARDVLLAALAPSDPHQP